VTCAPGSTTQFAHTGADSHEMANSLWKWWLGVGGTIVAVYPILPGETLSDIVYLSLAFSVPVAMAIGIRRFRPTPRAPWYWIATANVMLFSAEILWFVLDWMGLSPYPSAADVLSLIAYPCLAVGLALLVRHRTATRELSSLLDAAIVSIGAGIVTWSCSSDLCWAPPRRPRSNG